MADERQRNLQREASAGDPLAAAQTLIERLRAGAIDRSRLELAAYFADPGAEHALELLEGSVEVPDDPEDYVLKTLGRGQETNARVLLAAVRPCLPALAVWLPEVRWGAALAAIEAWLVTHDPAHVAELATLTKPLGEAPQFSGETAPPGAEEAALSLEPLRDLLRSILPDGCELPELPPPAPWRDPGHESRFPLEPCDARSVVFLFSEVIDDPAFSDDTAEGALESVVREYGGRYVTHLTQWARNCAFDSAAVYTGAWHTAYRTLGETIRAEVLPWCLGEQPPSAP